jgi:hypothetical protein
VASKPALCVCVCVCVRARAHAHARSCVCDAIICKETLKIQIMCIQDLFLPDKGVACISELESYAGGNVAAI